MENRVYLQQKREHIFLVFKVPNSRILVSSGVKIRKKHWEHNFVKKNHPEYPLIKANLENILRMGRRAIDSLPDNFTPTQLKEKYLELARYHQDKELRDFGLHLKYDFMEKMKSFIESKKVFYKESSVKKYVSLLNTLLDFEAQTGIRLDIETFDKRIFEQIVAFLLLNRNLLNNTVAKHVACLKTFIRNEYPDFDHSFVNFKTYRPEIIALSEDELRYLIKMPFTGIKEVAKDLFVFLCLTGMRISDAQRFDPNWITDEFIEYSAEKTMSKAYIPLHETVEGILEKYDGKPPQICDQYFNRVIKQVFFDIEMDRPIVKRHRQGKRLIEKIYPLHEVVSSHTGRKTFISMMLARGVPIQDVMNMSGHQDYRSMRPYIQVDKTKMAKYKNAIKF